MEFSWIVVAYCALPLCVELSSHATVLLGVSIRRVKCLWNQLMTTTNDSVVQRQRANMVRFTAVRFCHSTAFLCDVRL